MSIPSWDDYAVNLLRNISSRSQDPDTKVGCVILDTKKRIVGTGYNSPPSGVDLDMHEKERPNKYNYMIHAEVNAILYAEKDKLEDSTLYVDFLPCVECAKIICQVGVRRVVYCTDYKSKAKNANHDIAVDMLERKGIILEKYCLQ